MSDTVSSLSGLKGLKRVSTHKVERRINFRTAIAAAEGLLSIVHTIPPMAESKALGLQIWWGIDHRGTNIADGDGFELYFLPADVDNYPDAGGVRDRAIWAAIQQWAVGAGGHKVQVFEQSQTKFEGDFIKPSSVEVANTELATRTREMAWCFGIEALGGAFTVVIIGTLHTLDTFFQRHWGSDNYTWDVKTDGHDKLNSYQESNIDQDMESDSDC